MPTTAMLLPITKTDDLTEANLAVVSVDAAAIRALLHHLARFVTLRHSTGLDLARLEIHDGCARYFDASGFEGIAETADAIAFAETAIDRACAQCEPTLTRELPVYFTDAEDHDLRTDRDVLVVEHDSVCWRACDHYSDTWLETADVSREQLEEWLAELESPTSNAPTQAR